MKNDNKDIYNKKIVLSCSENVLLIKNPDKNMSTLHCAAQSFSANNNNMKYEMLLEP